MKDDVPKRICIIGAGPVGALCSLMLAARFPDAHIVLVDSRPDPRRPDSVAAGRSINIAFSHRGIAAIDSVNSQLCDRVKEQGVIMRGRMLHKLDKRRKSSLEPQDYGLFDKGEFLRSVSRTAVNSILLDGVDETGKIEVKWETKLLEFDLRGDDTVEITLGTRDGNRKTWHVDWVIGADGAYSMTRRQMLRAPRTRSVSCATLRKKAVCSSVLGRFDFSQHYATHDYMEFTMPASEKGEYRMPEPYLHIWPRREYMLIALPNQVPSSQD